MVSARRLSVLQVLLLGLSLCARLALQQQCVVSKAVAGHHPKANDECIRILDEAACFRNVCVPICSYVNENNTCCKSHVPAQLGQDGFKCSVCADCTVSSFECMSFASACRAQSEKLCKTPPIADFCDWHQGPAFLSSNATARSNGGGRVARSVVTPLMAVCAVIGGGIFAS